MRTSWWLALCGVIMGGAAAIFGLIDLVSVPRARALRIGWVHGLGNVTAMVITLINLLLRSAAPARTASSGLVLSVIAVAILLVTGWLGGELAYRHGIGVDVVEAQPGEERRATGT